MWTFFCMRTDGTRYALLYEFTGGADGRRPFGDLSIGPRRRALGTTAGFSEYTYAPARGTRSTGGASSSGAPRASPTRTPSRSPRRGAPFGPILGADGNLYGTTPSAAPTAAALDRGGSPQGQPGGPHAIQEGASVTLTATASDPLGGGFSYAWDLDLDGTFDDVTGRTASFAANCGPATETASTRSRSGGPAPRRG